MEKQLPRLYGKLICFTVTSSRSVGTYQRKTPVAIGLREVLEDDGPHRTRKMYCCIAGSGTDSIVRQLQPESYCPRLAPNGTYFGCFLFPPQRASGATLCQPSSYHTSFSSKISVGLAPGRDQQLGGYTKISLRIALRRAWSRSVVRLVS